MELNLQHDAGCISAYRTDCPCTVLVVDVPHDGDGDVFPVHILEKVQDRIPSSRLIDWGETGRIAILVSGVPSSTIARVADMICVEAAIFHAPERTSVVFDSSPHLSAASEV